jgi:putative aldouronate transport system permease protein
MAISLKTTRQSSADAFEFGVSAADSGPSKKKRRLSTRIWRHRVPLMMILPGLAFLLVFNYAPLLGNIVAFQNYSPYEGFVHSAFVGLANFAALVSAPGFAQAVVNTVEINLLLLIFAFPVPLILAILLHTMYSEFCKRAFQVVVYFPYFLSWVVVIAVWIQVFGTTGVFNAFLSRAGLGQSNFITDPALFKMNVVIQYIWKTAGFNMILFLAALSNVDLGLYEAAMLDGAGLLRRTWHVTLPAVKGITVLLLILSLGSILTIGFEQIYLQLPLVGTQAANVISTYVYTEGVIDGNISLSTAAGLAQSVVAMLLILLANRGAKLLGEAGLF